MAQGGPLKYWRNRISTFLCVYIFCCFWHGLAVEFITITTIPHCSPGPDSRGLTNFPPEQTLLTGLTPGSSWHSWHSWSPEILLWWQCRQHRLVSPGVSVFIGRQGVWSRRFTSTRRNPLTCSLSDWRRLRGTRGAGAGDLHQQGGTHWHALWLNVPLFGRPAQVVK